MPFQITIRAEAAKQFQALSAHDRGVVQQAIAAKLAATPDKETKASKRLRTNPIAKYELRVGDFRVLYDVDAARNLVMIVLVGEKCGNSLFVEGQEYHDHESHDAE